MRVTDDRFTSIPLREGWTFFPPGVDPDGKNGVPITLPHTWNALDGQDGGGDYARGCATYETQLEVVEEGEAWLEFRGVNSTADISLNGQHLCRHDGGYSTFRVNLTPALAPTNILRVEVDNAPNSHVYPQRADFTFYGGIYRDVWLLVRQPAHFRLDDGGPGIAATPKLLGTSAHVELAAEVSGGDQVRFTIDGVGSVETDIIEGRASAGIQIPEVHRWHGLRDPYLYTLKAELFSGEVCVDETVIRFGCREFEVDPDQGFLLNGEPYPLRGVSRHQDWLGAGNAITSEMMDEDLALIKELGATTVRLAHYQHDQHFYDLCDEAGLVVWAEIPQITGFLPNGTENAANQLTELIVQNRHHASIVCWGLSNEITVVGNPPELLQAHRELNDLAHRLDPTRLTAIANVFMLPTDDPLVSLPDVMSYNLYYGWYVGEVADNDDWLDEFHTANPAVAIGLSEYGADANLAAQTNEPRRGDYSEQFQAKYHEHMAKMIEDRPWLWATHVWNLADFAADARNEGGIPGRNLKGLVSFDRKVRKDAFYLYKATWSSEPFVHLAGRRYVDRPETVTEVTVYSNQPTVSLWCDDVLIGTQTGRPVFRFEVPLTGEHRITAKAGELTDSIAIRRVQEPNPAYIVTDQKVQNWFDADQFPAPDGYYSIYDTMAEIRNSAAGAALLDQLMAAASAARGDVAENVEIPEAMQRMVDRLSVAALLEQAGGVLGDDQVRMLNDSLNQIAKVTESIS